MSEPIIEVQNLKKHFPIDKGFFRRTVGHVRAVDDVSFSIRKGEVFGLVGESGSGKSTTALTILRAWLPTAGRVTFHDYRSGRTHELSSLRTRKLVPLRKELQVVFQDPYSSLNSRMTVREVISEPMVIHGEHNSKKIDEKVVHLLESVGLRAQHINRYPHAFSGGQRQRIAIARALSVDPQFLVCDESVSALDVSVQAQILNLLTDLQTQFDLTYLFIAHDLSVIKHICDRVGVMYAGKLVEVADTDDLFRAPRHPYTESLLSAVPEADPDVKATRIVLEGEIPNPANPPSGCYFHPRCPYAREICSTEEPQLGQPDGDTNRYDACLFSDELELTGVNEIPEEHSI